MNVTTRYSFFAVALLGCCCSLMCGCMMFGGSRTVGTLVVEGERAAIETVVRSHYHDISFIFGPSIHNPHSEYIDEPWYAKCEVLALVSNAANTTVWVYAKVENQSKKYQAVPLGPGESMVFFEGFLSQRGMGCSFARHLNTDDAEMHFNFQFSPSVPVLLRVPVSVTRGDP